MIGDKRPSDVITEEYAKADPFYVEKTVVCTLDSMLPVQWYHLAGSHSGTDPDFVTELASNLFSLSTCSR